MDDDQALWEFVDLEAWQRPNPPARAAVQRQFRVLLGQLFGKQSDEGQDDLQKVPDFLLGRAVPTFDNSPTQAALKTTLDPWLKSNQNSQPCQLFINPPGSNLDTTLRAFAAEEGWQVVSAPGGARLMRMDENLLRDMLSGRGNIVIPKLENWFLRHQDGLKFVRHIVEWTENTEARCLIGCHSWTWAYLDKALKIGSVLPRPITLAPFSAERLQHWFTNMAQSNKRGQFNFLRSDTGRPVLESDKEGEDSYFLRQLAAASRGIPGVAWALWRYALRVTPADGADVDVDMDVSAERGLTLWVDPWESVELPQPPANIGTAGVFVLHALLLHDGLDSESLDYILPFSFNQVRQELARLEDARLVAKDANHIWRVQWAAYPNVRQRLYDEGYLVDQF